MRLWILLFFPAALCFGESSLDTSKNPQHVPQRVKKHRTVNPPIRHNIQNHKVARSSLDTRAQSGQYDPLNPEATGMQPTYQTPKTIQENKIESSRSSLDTRNRSGIYDTMNQGPSLDPKEKSFLRSSSSRSSLDTRSESGVYDPMNTNEVKE